jgi:hypothetical protein
MKLQRLGGYAAITSICVFIVYIALSILVQKRFGDISGPVKVMAAVSAAPAGYYAFNMLMIVCFILLLIMVFALHERMQANAPHLTRMMLIAASAGTVMVVTEQMILLKSVEIIFPTQDVSAYRACSAIADGLHSMGGHAYGWAALLVGCAILRTSTFSRMLGWLFLLAGILLIPLFVVPQVYGISHLLVCVSTVWIGIALLRQQPQPALKEMASSK